MPISIVIGGQFGSEGKGKVALEIVRRSKGPVSVVRVGGPNSGHTAYDRSGKKWALRQMPAACVDRNVDVFFPAGSYIDIDLLFEEVRQLDYPEDRVFVSPYANVISDEHKLWEKEAGLVGSIGSTGSGVGAAVMAAVAREAKTFRLEAQHVHRNGRLQKFETDTSQVLRSSLDSHRRVVIEGSQGFGLSLLEGGFWPKATARSTTAAAALAEAGLSPRYVDDITMVLRAFPIRVAGASGPLPGETTWDSIAERSGRSDDLREYTTVTQKLRRVGEFNSSLVKRALSVNAPTRVVLNHLDYIDKQDALHEQNGPLRNFINFVEAETNQHIDWLGFSPLGIIEKNEAMA